MVNDHRPITSTSIPKAIWGLGIAVFFVNLSSVMIRSLAAIYMKTILGVGTGWIGIVEGVLEGLSFLMKMMSGVFSDYLRRRKLIIVIGYGCMMISRPIMALFASLHAVILARALDRLGNGIQASPRDALVGDFAPQEIRGACYGLRISLGTAGSFLGALCGLVLMYLHNDDYQKVFLLATIPAAIAVAIMVF
ncbi:MAG TPA: MFS transporter, partial [Candidatus Nitrosotenuis sp.]|nr:MFS transporter [Candidatus Nitrosotenuis sp.]